MTSLLHDDRIVQHDTDPLALCQSVVLPRSDTLLQAVERVRDCYLAATGESMDYRNAIHVLDQIRAERGLDGPTPPLIPDDLSPIARWLREHGYDRHAIVLAIRDLKLGGKAKGSPFIETDDVPYIEEILASIRGGAR